VKLIVASNDAYNAGDLDTVFEFYAADIEAFPDASVFLEAVRSTGVMSSEPGSKR
jgi:ketosteroid isomerase-like protein